MPKVDFREEVVNVALAELLERRGLSEARYVATWSMARWISMLGEQGDEASLRRSLTPIKLPSELTAFLH
jgi:hypothetical protein